MIVRDRNGTLHRNLIRENGRIDLAGARIDNLKLESADLRRADFSDSVLGGKIGVRPRFGININHP